MAVPKSDGSGKVVVQWMDQSELSPNIADGSIGTSKIADNAINGSKILDGTVAEADLANDLISSGKLQDNAVTNSKIQDGAVTINEINTTGLGLKEADLVVASDGTGDYTNIQDAIDNLPNGKGHIIVKEGTYSITAQINLVSDLTLQGAGSATVIKATSAGITMLHASNKSNIVIRNLFLEGNAVADRSIHIEDSTHVSILDCTISGLDSTSTGTPIHLDGQSTVSSTNFLVHNNRFINNPVVVAVFAENISSSKITCNYFIDSTIDIGLFVQDCFFIVINNNIFSDNTDFGILLSSIEQSIVSGNIVRNSGQQAISVSTSNDNVISNNIFFNNVDDGIRVISSDRNVFIGNNIQNNTNEGLDITSTASEDNLVVGNTALNNTGSQISDSGLNTTVTANKTS